jgi:ketosteroid isomerase-like protein
MSTDDNKALVKRFFDAGNRGDMDTCTALIDDDVTWTNIGTTRFSGTYRGKPAVLAELIGPLFGALKQGIHTTIEALHADGDVVVVQSQGQAETHDGRPYNNSYCQVMTVRGGRIVAVTEYMDTALIDATFGPAA